MSKKNYIFILVMLFLTGCTTLNKHETKTISLQENLTPYDISLIRIWDEVKSNCNIPNGSPTLLNNFSLKYQSNGRINDLFFDFIVEGDYKQYYKVEMKNYKLIISESKWGGTSDHQYSSLDLIFSEIDKIGFKGLEQGSQPGKDEHYLFSIHNKGSREQSLSPELIAFKLNNGKIYPISKDSDRIYSGHGNVLVKSLIKTINSSEQPLNQDVYFIINENAPGK